MLVIEQDGKDFTITVKTPLRTHVNTFTIGKETEIITMDGRKLKVYHLLIIFLLLSCIHSFYIHINVFLYMLTVPRQRREWEADN